MKKIGRKEFIKIGAGAAAGGLAGYVFSGAPFKGLQWLVEKTQDQLIPAKGAEKYLKALCQTCGQNCEISIRMTGNRAVMIETSNSGCPFGQNALQMLYHPERIDSPLKRTGSKGNAEISSFKKISWDEAINDISSGINNLISKNKSQYIAGINRYDNLASSLLKRLINAAGSPHVYYEPSVDMLADSAFGGHIEYDFMNTDLILSFGARLFEGWGSPAVMNKALMEWKKKGVRIIQADTLCTRTASMADWINIKPGTEIFLAAAIANHLAEKNGKRIPDAAWNSVIRDYSPDRASSLTGLSAGRIQEIAEAFSQAKNPVAVAGRGGSAVSSSSAEMMLVHSLNIMSGTKTAILKKNSFLNLPDIRRHLNTAASYSGIDDFIKNGNPEMIFINESDPVYKSTWGKHLSEKLEKAFVVSITPLLNDTAMYADYVLPPLVFPGESLKSNIAKENTVFSKTSETKHIGDMIISLSKKIPQSAGDFPWSDYADSVRNNKHSVKSCDMKFNADILENGLASLEKRLTQNDYPLTLVPFELAFLGDGDGLAFPYILKTIDSKTYSNGKLWVHMNKETASRYGISEGKYITIKSARGKTGKLRVHLTGTVPPDAIAAPMGFGHKSYTKYAMGKGINFREIMTNDIDPVSGTADWWITKVRI